MHSRRVFGSGLTAHIEELAQVRSVSLGLLIKSGSRYENKKEVGVSHFIEHMVFKGNAKLSAFEIAESFDLLGASIDAFTSREYTCFYVRMVDEYLPQVMKLLSEMILAPAFSREEILREKEVIFEEIKMYLDSPDEFTFDTFLEGIYGGHPLGHPILGFEDTVKGFEQKNVLEYHKRFYSPENAIISAAGNVKKDDFYALVEKYFGAWKKSGNVIQTLPPAYDFKDQEINKKLEQVHVCLGTEGLSFRHQDRFKLLVMNEILGGSMSSHLFQEVREKRGLCYSISSHADSYSDSGIIFIYAATDREKLAKLLEIVNAELEKMKTAITEKELTKVKQQVKGSYILSMENTTNRMTRLLKQEFYKEKFLELDGIMEEIEKIKKEDLMEFAERLFVKARMKLLTVGPK